MRIILVWLRNSRRERAKSWMAAIGAAPVIPIILHAKGPHLIHLLARPNDLRFKDLRQTTSRRVISVSNLVVLHSTQGNAEALGASSLAAFDCFRVKGE